ncbi:hypothetical protein [Croceicoccus gelatinilyticus]|uniref:hypothetical protein n=1 Tax=Croceicoccus gelatinilyticus TaxID=2835536 RepID=UPI001BCF4DA5|nr:hypothetical protein [Croceicoccus gelatinilyticus]MBS7670995.1 hypothetical protein [Croceicoccus gelatinilyticus]
MLAKEQLAEAQIGDQYKPISPVACAWVGLQAAAASEGDSPIFTYCAVGDLAYDSDPPTAMARAFIQYFESHGEELQGQMGLTAFAKALLHTWPCEN